MCECVHQSWYNIMLGIKLTDTPVSAASCHPLNSFLSRESDTAPNLCLSNKRQQLS